MRKIQIQLDLDFDEDLLQRAHAQGRAVTEAVARERREVETLLEALRERAHAQSVELGAGGAKWSPGFVEGLDVALQVLRDRSRGQM